MHSFLSTITLGEYVAATDCDYAIRYYSAKNNMHAVQEYTQIKKDEQRHFELLKGLIAKVSGVPKIAKDLFRGSFMENHIGELER